MKRALIFLGIILLASFGWKALVLRGLHQMKEGKYGKMNRLLVENEKFDILFLGNSRYEYQITPGTMSLIDANGSQLKTYNAGLSSSNTRVHQAVLEHLIANEQSPELLVIGFDYLYWRYKSVDRINDINRYTPYISDPAIRDAITQFDKSAFIQHYFPPYFVTSFSDHSYHSAYKGYTQTYSHADSAFSAYGHWTPPAKALGAFYNLKENTPRMDENFQSEIDATRAIVNLCKENNIELVVMAPPIYQESYEFFIEDNFSTKDFKSLISELKLTLIDLSDTWISQQKDLFADEIHLNTKGLEPFNKMLEEKIQQHIATLF